MPTRLDSEDPEMVANLRAMSPASLRTAAKTIASLAVERAGIRDPRMDAGLAALRNQGWDDAQIRRGLQQLTAELDEVAWNIQDQVDEGTASEDEYASAFMRARAASSLDFALNGDAFTAAAESI